MPIVDSSLMDVVIELQHSEAHSGLRSFALVISRRMAVKRDCCTFAVVAHWSRGCRTVEKSAFRCLVAESYAYRSAVHARGVRL